MKKEIATGESYMMVNMEYTIKLEQQIATLVEALKDAHGLIYEAIAQMTRKQLDGLSDGFEARREAGEQALALVEGGGL